MGSSHAAMSDTGASAAGRSAPRPVLTLPPWPCVLGVVGAPTRETPRDAERLRRVLLQTARVSDTIATVAAQHGVPWFVARLLASDHVWTRSHTADPDTCPTQAILPSALVIAASADLLVVLRDPAAPSEADEAADLFESRGLRAFLFAV